MLGYYGNLKFKDRYEILDYFSRHSQLGLDIEYDDGLLCIALGTATHGFFITPDDPDIDRVIARIQQISLVIHNASYDIPILEHLYGIKLHTYEDSMLAAQSLGYPAALGDLSYQFNFSWVSVMSLLYSAAGIKKKNAKLKDVPRDEVGKICAMHAMGCYKIWQALESKVGEAYGQDMKLMPVLVNMERRGIAVDTALVKQKYDIIQEAVTELKTMAENRGYNPASSTQVGIYLSHKGINPGFSRSRKMKTDKASLKPFIQDKDVALILAFRGLSKQASTYLKPMLKKDRQYSHYHVVGTGRLASKPNIQNVPMPMRDIYIPNEGEWLVSLDLTQIEPRIAAYMSQDQALMKAVATGDIYQPIADALHIDRKTAKVMWLAMSYGAGAATLAEKGDISLATAVTLLQALAKAYPRLTEWEEEVKNIAIQTSYVTTLLGRVRDMEGQEKDAPNTIIQGTASEVLKDMMLELRDYAQVASIHDECLLSMPKGELPTLHFDTWHGIPISYKVSAGASYGALEALK